MTESIRVGDTVRVITPEFIGTRGGMHRSARFKAGDVFEVTRINDDTGNLINGLEGCVAPQNVELVRPADGFKPGDHVRIVRPVFRYKDVVRPNVFVEPDRVYVVADPVNTTDNQLYGNVLVYPLGKPESINWISILPEGLELVSQAKPRQFATGHVYITSFDGSKSSDWLAIGKVSDEAQKLVFGDSLPEAPKKARPTWADVREGDIVTAEGEIYLPESQVSYNAVLTGPIVRASGRTGPVAWGLKWYGEIFASRSEVGPTDWTVLEIERPTAAEAPEPRPLAERRKPRKFQLLRDAKPVWIWQGYTRKAVGEGVVENGVLIIDGHTEVDISPKTDTLQLWVDITGIGDSVVEGGGIWVNLTHALGTAEAITHEEA